MIVLAREAAAKYLTERGFLQEADIVTRGEGDDFLEVRLAKSLLEVLTAQQAKRRLKFARRTAGEEC